MKTIEVKDPSVEGVSGNLREVIGEEVTYRLAQQPGSYAVLKYVRPVVKRKDNLAIMTASAPVQVLERTAADVSFLAGMVIDKFRFHLPIYRQHQRLHDSGIVVSCSSLNTWASRAIDLLVPVVWSATAVKDTPPTHAAAPGKSSTLSVGAIPDVSLNAPRTSSPKRWPRPWPSSARCTAMRSRSAKTR